MLLIKVYTCVHKNQSFLDLNIESYFTVLRSMVNTIKNEEKKMSNQPISIQGYALNQPLVALAQRPIIARRAPTVNNRAQLGQIWIQPTDTAGVAVNGAWILTSIIANVATWTDIGQSGTATFANLTVTGTTQLNILNVSGLATFNGSVSMDPTAAASTFTFGNAAMTGNIIIGNSTAGQAISIGGAINTGAQSISLGSGASGANSTVNILTGNGTAGTQTFNALTGTRAGAMNLATGAAANTSIIGTITAGSTLTLRAPTSIGVALTTGATTVNILCGAGDPNTVVTAPQGSLYTNTTGSGVANRLWVNTTGAAVWTNVVTAA